VYGGAGLEVNMGVLALTWLSLALAGSSVQMDSISVDGVRS
jgi:hypothetical protein